MHGFWNNESSFALEKVWGRLSGIERKLTKVILPMLAAVQQLISLFEGQMREED